MLKQLTAEQELSNALKNFGERVKNTGLILWHRIFEKKLDQIIANSKAKDAAIYGELMLLESMANKIDSAKSAEIVKKIQKLKGIFGTLCLCFLCLSADLQFRAVRGRVRGGGSKVVRVLRKEGGAAA